jgi:hypothetical protein
MEEKLIDRIGDEYLNGNFQDGQILLNSDVNEIVSIVKEGINANFNDIQKIQNGSHQVGNSKQLDGADLSRFSDGEMVGSDKLIPTSQQVKSYVDSKVQEIKDTTEVGKLVEDLNALSINVENKVDKEDLVNEETTGTDKAYNCDYINELFENGVGDSLPIGTIVEYTGENIPDGFEKVEEPEDATVYIGPNEPTDGQDVWIQKGKNLYNKKTAVLGYLNEDGSIYPESTYCTSTFISVSPNTTYFKTVTESVRAKYYDKNKKPLTDSYNDLGGSGAFAFTTPSNAYYLRVSMLGDCSDTLQIELGDAPTEYEEYVCKKVYTKNSDGGYEEFYSEGEVNKQVYSLGEQRIGTWKDGKPLYMKVVEFITSANTDSFDITSLHIDTLIPETKANLDCNGVTQTLGHYGGPNDWSRWHTYNNNGTMFILCGDTYSGLEKLCTFILKYTKTTD